MNKLIEKHGNIEIWHDTHADKYYVYGVTMSGDPRIAPSIGMARAFAETDAEWSEFMLSHCGETDAS